MKHLLAILLFSVASNVLVLTQGHASSEEKPSERLAQAVKPTSTLYRGMKFRDFYHLEGTIYDDVISQTLYRRPRGRDNFVNLSPGPRSMTMLQALNALEETIALEELALRNGAPFFERDGKRETPNPHALRYRKQTLAEAKRKLQDLMQSIAQTDAQKAFDYRALSDTMALRGSLSTRDLELRGLKHFDAETALNPSPGTDEQNWLARAREVGRQTERQIKDVRGSNSRSLLLMLGLAAASSAASASTNASAPVLPDVRGESTAENN